MKYEYKKKIEIDKDTIVELYDYYIKKPVEIRAVNYYDKEIFFEDDVPNWIADAVESGIIFYGCNHNNNGECVEELFIKTLEGDMHVSEGDYIIEGVRGELYPCKPDIFEATYEEKKLNIR